MIFKTPFDVFILYRVTPHPSYNQEKPKRFDNDAALLKLQRKVDYGILPNVYPACWPSQMPQKGEIVRISAYKPESEWKLTSILQATVSGFGRTSNGGDVSLTLKEVFLTLYSILSILSYLNLVVWVTGQCWDLVQPYLSTVQLVGWHGSPDNHRQHAVCRELAWWNGCLPGEMQNNMT